MGCLYAVRVTDEIDPDFFEARAIVFSKMGQHRQALEIYVFNLGDYAKAEEYVSSLFVMQCTNTRQGTVTKSIWRKTRWR